MDSEYSRTSVSYLEVASSQRQAMLDNKLKDEEAHLVQLSISQGLPCNEYDEAMPIEAAEWMKEEHNKQACHPAPVTPFLQSSNLELRRTQK